MAVRFHLSITQPGRRVLDVIVRDSLAVGRDCDGLLLADPQASRAHAEFRQTGDVLTVFDNGSTNGTFVNGCRTHPSAVVRAGDEVRIGDSHITVAIEADPWKFSDAGASSPTDDGRDLISKAVDRISPGTGAPWPTPGPTEPAPGPAGKVSSADRVIDELPPTEAHQTVFAGGESSAGGTGGVDREESEGLDLRESAGPSSPSQNGRGRQAVTQRVEVPSGGLVASNDSTWQYGRTSIMDEFLSELRRTELSLGAHGPDGTVTVAVVELADGETRARQAGADRWAECCEEWQAIVDDAAADAGGRQLCRWNHAYAFAFPSPRRAVRWAMLANAGLAERFGPPDSVSARVGLHLDSYDPREPRGLREIAEIAAGITHAAAGGEILASTAARNVAVDRHQLRFGVTRLVPQPHGRGLMEVVAADITAEIPFPS